MKRGKFSVQDAAAVLGWDVRFVRAAIQQGRVPWGIMVEHKSRRTYMVNLEKLIRHEAVPRETVSDYCREHGIDY